MAENQNQQNRPESGLQEWHPFRNLAEMRQRVDDYFGRPFFPSPWRRYLAEDLAWSPTIDVQEKDDKFIVKAELPGVNEEDIDVSVSGDMLTISGEKQAESEAKKKGYSYSESYYGKFSRSINMPSTVDPEKIQANYDKGVLEITLPKVPAAKPKKINVITSKKEETTSK